MSISIQDYKTLNYYFGDALNSMKNDLLRILISNNRDDLLEEFDEMLRLLEDEKGLAELIHRYKTKYVNDFGRFESLVSEIRAGYFLQSHDLPVEFLSDNVQKGRSADIKTRIENVNAYVEVKKITRKELELEKINEEFRKLEIPLWLMITISKPVYSAKDVAIEIQSALLNKTSSSISTELEFKYGTFKIIGTVPRGVVLGYEWSVHNRKNENSNSFVTREELERQIESNLEDATDQLLKSANSSDMLFVLIDNPDTRFMDHHYVFNKFYGGSLTEKKIDIHPKIIGAEKNSWGKFLKDLNFIPTTSLIDYKLNSGWIFYSKSADDLNGIFYICGERFKYDNNFIFLNPFVKRERNFSNLQSVFDYYNPAND